MDEYTPTINAVHYTAVDRQRADVTVDGQFISGVYQGHALWKHVQNAINAGTVTPTGPDAPPAPDPIEEQITELESELAALDANTSRVVRTVLAGSLGLAQAKRGDYVRLRKTELLAEKLREEIKALRDEQAEPDYDGGLDEQIVLPNVNNAGPRLFQEGQGFAYSASPTSWGWTNEKAHDDDNEAIPGTGGFVLTPNGDVTFMRPVVAPKAQPPAADDTGPEGQGEG